MKSWAGRGVAWRGGTGRYGAIRSRAGRGVAWGVRQGGGHGE